MTTYRVNFKSTTITRKQIKLKAKDFKPDVEWIYPNKLNIFVIIDLKSLVLILPNTSLIIEQWCLMYCIFIVMIICTLIYRNKQMHVDLSFKYACMHVYRYYESDLFVSQYDFNFPMFFNCTCNWRNENIRAFHS